MMENFKQIILDLLSKTNSAIDIKKITLHLPEEKRQEFFQAVDILNGEGKLILTKNKKIISPRASGLVAAKIVSYSRSFAFARSIDSNEDFYISSENLKLAKVGDLVMLNHIKSSSRGLNAKVERIVLKANRLINGVFYENFRGQYVIADKGYRDAIPVLYGYALDAKPGDKVNGYLIDISKKRNILIKINKVYGSAQSAQICTQSIIDEYDVPTKFSDEVINEAKAIEKTTIKESDIMNRVDLRESLIFTIDGEDAKDLDDAISIKATDSGWDLGVHIADVSHYVKAGHPLDIEAQTRGTSIYFANKVIPMLPKEISNGTCSLNSGQDKLTFSALMKVDKKGNLVSYEFKKSVINSKVRGVYSEVNQILNESADKNLKEKYRPVLESLLEAQKLSNILSDNAKKRGHLDLDSGESFLKLNDEGVCIDILPRVRGEAEAIIENFMIMANQAAAIYAKYSQIPFIYRVHDEPYAERLENLKRIADILGFNTRHIKEGVKTTDLEKLIEQSKKTNYENIISNQVLRSMAKAVYKSEPLGHFGLSLEDYSHFTSPIRRYPDLAIHRILSDLVKGESIDKIETRYRQYVIAASESSSECEVKAMNLERDVEKLYMAEYMASHIGEIFEGVIASVRTHGVFVALKNGVQGFVSLQEFPKCSFVYDHFMTQQDRLSKFKLTLGDKMTIKVKKSDVSSGMIDFEPVLKK